MKLVYCIIITASLFVKRAGSEYIFENSTRPRTFDAAKSTCMELGGELWLPTADDTTQIVNSQESTWIDLKMEETAWHWREGEREILPIDQGCYVDKESYKIGDNYVDMTERNSSYCPSFCQRRSSPFYALQDVGDDMLIFDGLQWLGGSHWYCICLKKVPISNREPEAHCTSDCPDHDGFICGENRRGANMPPTVRIFALNGDATMRWMDGPKISHDFLQCGSYRNLHRGQTTHDDRLEARNCNDRLDYVCVDQEENHFVAHRNRETWFDSLTSCQSGNMTLLPLSMIDPNNGSKVASNVSFWSALKAWTWVSTSTGFSQDSVCGDCWASGYPAPSYGLCIIVNEQGLWQNTHCTRHENFVCKIPKADDTLNNSQSGSNSLTDDTADIVGMNYPLILALVVGAPVVLFVFSATVGFICWRVRKRELKAGIEKKRVLSTSSCYGLTDRGAALRHLNSDHIYSEAGRSSVVQTNAAANVYEEVQLGSVANGNTDIHMQENDLYSSEHASQEPERDDGTTADAIPKESDKPVIKLPACKSYTMSGIDAKPILCSNMPSKIMAASCSNLHAREGYLDMAKKAHSRNPRLATLDDRRLYTLPARYSAPNPPEYLELTPLTANSDSTVLMK